MEMFPNDKQDKVVPESFRIILRLYLRRPESKSLAPDGTPCVADTQGLLKRASVVAGEIIPVGKDTDRRWEQGEDMSLVDFKVLEYWPAGNMVVADTTQIDQIARLPKKELVRRSNLDRNTIRRILRGQPVRRATLQRAVAAARCFVS